MGGKTPKSYNNEKAWDKIEQAQQSKPKIVQSSPFDMREFDETEFVETVVVEDINNRENFDEVLELTQYGDNSLQPLGNGYMPIAEYKEINTTEISLQHQTMAKNFVSKITKFVLEFNDVELTEEHRQYIKEVGDLQFQHLSDSLYLVDVNKQMLNNIIARINATQAEDYAIISTYNNLATQHLKLMKETQSIYKSIPTVIKKMKADIICNQELTGGDDSGVMTEDFGTTQFNNSKQFLRELAESYKEPVPKDN